MNIGCRGEQIEIWRTHGEMCFYSVSPSIINYCHVITSSSSRSPSAQLQGHNKQRILKRFISIHKLKWNNNRLSGLLHGKVWGWGAS